jgi:hypothetical protein
MKAMGTKAIPRLPLDSSAELALKSAAADEGADSLGVARDDLMGAML